MSAGAPGEAATGRRPPRRLVKICGVTRRRDAELAAELGADLLGLNFFPPSPRCLDPERGREIADAVRGAVRLVGVFVDRDPDEVEAIGREVGLDLFQFHGDEGPGELAPFAGRAIKVFRIRGGLAAADLEPYRDAWGFLVESRHPGYGGAGARWEYETIAGLGAAKPLLVSGGIVPGTAREALARSGADGLDVCSGVESAPGVKDPERLAALIREVRALDG